MDTLTNQSSLTNSFEWYWSQYINKLARLDELKASGRYGYQLRMPKLAINHARIALVDFCNANQIECPTCAQ